MNTDTIRLSGRSPKVSAIFLVTFSCVGIVIDGCVMETIRSGLNHWEYKRISGNAKDIICVPGDLHSLRYATRGGPLVLVEKNEKMKSASFHIIKSINRLHNSNLDFIICYDYKELPCPAPFTE